MNWIPIIAQRVKNVKLKMEKGLFAGNTKFTDSGVFKLILLYVVMCVEQMCVLYGPYLEDFYVVST